MGGGEALLKPPGVELRQACLSQAWRGWMQEDLGMDMGLVGWRLFSAIVVIVDKRNLRKERFILASTISVYHNRKRMTSSAYIEVLAVSWLEAGLCCVMAGGQEAESMT